MTTVLVFYSRWYVLKGCCTTHQLLGALGDRVQILRLPTVFKIRASFKVMATTCYFSKKCRHCQAFFQELHATPYAKDMRFVCVDPSPSRPALPAWLKSVPTLVVAGESGPRVGPSAVNNWLFERRLLTQGGGGGGIAESRPKVLDVPPSYMTPPAAPAKGGALPEPISASTPATSKQGPPVLPGSQMDGPVQAWHSEMDGGSWSDNYSFVEDTFTSEKGINPIIRNFESLVQPVGIPGITGPAAGRGGGGLGAAAFSGQAPRSAKEEKLLKEFEAFSKSRDMDFAPIRRQ
jgi:hypothetical protein